MLAARRSAPMEGHGAEDKGRTPLSEIKCDDIVILIDAVMVPVFVSYIVLKCAYRTLISCT